MNKKALTAAIAASLAAPMAAQAVEFSISGHVNRGLFLTDYTDVETGEDRSRVTVQNNGSSSTRIRATGSGELDTGHTAGIQWEYQETSDGSLGIRHANVWFSGDFGKVTLGQGSEAGDGSAYSDKTGVFGIGHGQDFGQAEDEDEADLGEGYFPSLDGGTRTDMIRYDTPALGPVNIAVSGANDDRYSARARVDVEAMGADIRGQLAYLKEPNLNETTGLSFGSHFDNGFTWSVAWASQDLHEMDHDPSYIQSTVGYVFGNNAVGLSLYMGEETGGMDGPLAGDSPVDHVYDTESRAIGIGFIHKMPKAGVDLYAAVQNYDVEDSVVTTAYSDGGTPNDDADDTARVTGTDSRDATVLVVGARIKF